MPLSSLEQLVDRRRRAAGAWRLSPAHELEYRARGAEEELLLRARLIAAEPDALVAQVTERFVDGGFKSRLIRLNGKWEADGRNRLTFSVQKQHGGADRLTFEGGWELAGQRIVYRAGESTLLRFEGYWELQPDLRLTYVLDRDSGSGFRFRGTLQTPLVLPKRGEVRYQIGVELKQRIRTHSVTLFGKWRLSRDFGLELQLDRPGTAAAAVRFGASYRLGQRSEITADLIAADGRPTGLEVVLTRSFLKGQGEAFSSLRRTLNETAVSAGVRLRW